MDCKILIISLLIIVILAIVFIKWFAKNIHKIAKTNGMIAYFGLTDISGYMSIWLDDNTLIMNKGVAQPEDMPENAVIRELIFSRKGQHIVLNPATDKLEIVE